MKNYITVLFPFIIFCFGCISDAEMPNRNHYILKAEAFVSEDNGVVFKAVADAESDEVIIERGFFVHRNYTYTFNDGYLEPDKREDTYPISLEGDFELSLSGDWDNNASCSAYAYIKTAKYKYVSDIVSFVSPQGAPPVIHSLSQEYDDYYGNYILIKGDNFSFELLRNRVYVDTDTRNRLRL